MSLMPHASAPIDRAHQAPAASRVGRKAARPRRQQPLFPLDDRSALALPHELELFGSNFKVYISTGLTISPLTASQAVLDMSMISAIREGLPKHYQSLRKLMYIVRGKHKPTTTTQKALIKDFGGILGEEELRGAFAGESAPAAPISEWKFLLQGLQGEGGVLADIASCLAACDAHLLEFVAPTALASGQEAVAAHLNVLLGEERAAWRALNPRLSTNVLVIVEVALKTLAWLECQLDPGPPGRDPDRSAVDALLDPGRKPMGNWLAEVSCASGCLGLGKLESVLLRRGAKHLNRNISHDLLRKWASPKRGLMPRTAVRPVLAGVRVESEANKLRSRYYVARFFTFLCALLRAGTIAESRPGWDEVQAHVRSRYAQAYRLQVGRASGHDPATA